mmetsp:Transcript_103097/g.295760  ORF Transcript_103097/g.295760 Transcript_103097/m.295760 type:complete len:226 (-) Transcript_103097:122-799(-)
MKSGGCANWRLVPVITAVGAASVAHVRARLSLRRPLLGSRFCRTLGGMSSLLRQGGRSRRPRRVRRYQRTLSSLSNARGRRRGRHLRSSVWWLVRAVRHEPPKAPSSNMHGPMPLYTPRMRGLWRQARQARQTRQTRLWPKACRLTRRAPTCASGPWRSPRPRSTRWATCRPPSGLMPRGRLSRVLAWVWAAVVVFGGRVKGCDEDDSAAALAARGRDNQPPWPG